MNVRDFVSMQLCFGSELRFTVHSDGREEALTVSNSAELGPREVEAWDVEGGRMHLYVRGGQRADLVSAELPAGAEL